MPADDLIINVRQIAGYPPVETAPPASALLLQLAGLGGPYASISPQDLVSTALAQGGDMAIGGQLTAQSFMGGSAQFANVSANLFSAQKACVVDLDATWATICGVQVATVAHLAAQSAASVQSFMGRVGAVILNINDIMFAGGAPLWSPEFSGCPTAPTPPIGDFSFRLATTAFVTNAFASLQLDYAPINSPNFTGVPTAPTPPLGSSDATLATTAFVQTAVSESTAGVASFNTRTGIVTLTNADVTAAGGAVLNSPAFTGTPTAPTPPPGDSSTRIATTSFVLTESGFAPLASPTFTGVPAAPTPTPGTNTTQLATTAYVQTAITGISIGVSTFNGRSGAVSLLANDITAAGGAILASPAFTGTPTAPNPPPGDSSTRLATTAYVQSLAGFAPIASPDFTGVPTAPTAAFGTNTTQLATTAFVEAAITGSTSGVSTFNGRTGAVTLQANDLTAAGGALLASPALTGTPSAPTAAGGTNSTQLATTAYVQTAIAARGGVLSFNGRAGAVTLTTADITGAGGAPLASPAFTGTPVAPTAGTGTNTTQLATTAFVLAQIAASGPAASTAAPLMNGVASAGSSAAYSRGDHVHPTDTTRFPTTGGLISGATSISGVLTMGANLILATSFQTSAAALGAFANTPNINYLTSTGLIVEHNSAPVVSVNRSQVGVGLAVIQFFQNSSANTGSISVSNQATTQYNTSSDGRLKEDRQPIKSGELIDAIEVYDFRWKAPISRSGREVRGHGVIAQDVFEIFPDAISHDTDADTWGADYSKFVPMLIAETKALRIRVAQLEARS